MKHSENIKSLNLSLPYEVVDKNANLVAKFYDLGSLIFYLMKCDENQRFLKEPGKNGSYQLWSNPDTFGVFDLKKDWTGRK